MHVAARGLADSEANGTSLTQCRNAHAAPHTRLDGLGGDLTSAEEHYRVDRLERNALVAVR